MTPDEQRMIQDLFQRLASQGRVAKDAQADRLISDSLRTNPDAGYMLVQTALVYEHQMNEQELRIRELEDQIAQLQTSASAPAGGSFLGGRIPAAGRGSVPSVASQPTASPWQAAPQQSAAYQQPAPQRSGMFGGAPAPMAQQAMPGGGGGFFRSALTTAAGVAGGMMVANSLSGLFGGGHEAHGATHTDNSGALADADTTQDDLQDQAGYEPEPEPAADTSSGWDDVET